MNSIISARWMRRSGLILASAALTIVLFGSLSQPTFSTSLGAQLRARMTALQQSKERWIEIDLTRQRLIAWEGENSVYAVMVSTGKTSTPTRSGTFHIQSKYRTHRMRGADYDVPNVPYAMYYSGGYAIHGAYWHHRFGTPVSHGCVNVAVDHAAWLFNWAAIGTPVIIHH